MENETVQNEDRNYCVYVHTNKINDKKYVGQTCREPKERWRNGFGYSESGHFFNAIKKYGWDNFKHDIIKNELTKEEADKLEEYYINKFDTLNSNSGYNLRHGGSRGRHSKQTLEKLSNAHMGIKRTKESIEKGKENIIKARGVPVFQYDADGNLMKKWDYIAKAAQELGIQDSSISDCCAGRVKKAGGFIWRNVDEPLTEEHLKWCNTDGRQIKRKIGQYTKDKKLIKVWDNGAEASRELNINGGHISSCCNNKRKTAGGYIWRFMD